MKFNITRSFMHFEYAEVEADSREEALRIAHQDLNEEDWEEDENAYLTEGWIYEAEEIKE